MSNQRAFSLIEVLVAVLIVAVGVLGVAGLNLVTMRTNTGSLMRTQANQLAYNIIDRIRANAAAVANYEIAMGDAAPVADTNCEAATCNPAQMSNFDRADWFAALAVLPSGDGAIDVDGNTVAVTLQWDDDNIADNALTSMTVRTQLAAAAGGP